MPERARLLQSIATIISDYRAGELAQPTPGHVEHWISQFAPAIQQPLLAEMEYVLRHTYFTRQYVTRFFEALITYDRLVGSDPCAFWQSARFLNLQTAGNSQRNLLSIFDAELRAKCNFGVNECGQCPQSFIYVDDALFSGGRIRSDLIAWLGDSAPPNATVFVITIARHTQGHYISEKELRKASAETGKNIAFRWVSRYVIEDRKSHTNVSDVLRPTQIPDDQPTQHYVEKLGVEPVLRLPGNVGGNGFFSSETGRSLLEQEFLKQGVRIREMCPFLNVYQRPLGNTLFRKLGFGSTIVTYRNCPNNAPLALWAGDPWYPLFPRVTN